MATYVIGDVHGCFHTLEALLGRLDLDLAHDRIWLVGDLVNRGPGSLQALRWAVEHTEKIEAVLGNHELHLLAVEAGAAKLRKKDTLAAILEASDRDDLLAWVRSRPLLHREGRTLLVHAGLRPSWTEEEAEKRARTCERVLQGDGAHEALAALRGRTADQRRPVPKKLMDLDFMTRARVVGKKGDPRYGFTGPPDQAPAGCRPWFSLPSRRHRKSRVIFGHWAALGYYQERGIIALDTGCYWGGELTALRLEDGALFRQVSELARG